MREYQTPWPHVIEDNYLTFEDYISLRGEAKLLKPGENSDIIYSVSDVLRTNQSPIPLDVSALMDGSEVVRSRVLQRKLPELIYLADVAKPWTESLPTELFIGTRLQHMKDGYKHPIHNDREDILFSGIVYLSPERNVGTHLYEMDGKTHSKTVEWRENRFIGYGSWGRYPHSFEAVGSRYTFSFFLVTKERLLRPENQHMYDEYKRR